MSFIWTRQKHGSLMEIKFKIPVLQFTFCNSHFFTYTLSRK